MDFSEAWPHAQSSLSAAIKSGDKARFKELLAANCPVDVADNRGWRPLHVAAAEGEHSFVRRLLQHEDTNVNWTTFEGETALWLATKLGHKKTCQILLRHAARTDIANNEKQYPLHIGVMKRNTGCVRLLLRNGAQIDAVDWEERTALHEAANIGHVSTVRLLLESGATVDPEDLRGVTPLLLAAASGNLRCVKAIREGLGRHHTVDAVTLDGITPLMIAAETGRLDCLAYLLDEGADACHAARDFGLAIHLATEKGHLSCVKVLMPLTDEDALLKACYGEFNKAMDPNWLPPLRDTLATTDWRIGLPSLGGSVLHLAVWYNRIEILDYLLKSGVDPNLYVTENWESPLPDTALGLACHMCNEEAVNVLLDAGARFHVGNDSICDPVHRAFYNPKCSREFVHFLVARGANLRVYCRKDGHLSFNFNRPDLLLEWMTLGGCFAKDNTNLECLIRDKALKCPEWADGALMDIMFVLARFLPAANMRSLYDAVRSVLDIDGSTLEGRWRELLQILVTPRTLLEQCRAKTRDVLMAREGYNLLHDIPKLELPAILQDYLLFREG